MYYVYLLLVTPECHGREAVDEGPGLNLVSAEPTLLPGNSPDATGVSPWRVSRSDTTQNQLYVGYTEDLEVRLNKHNAGEVQSIKPYRPWTLIYYEAFTNKKDAKQREQYLKTTKGRRTMRLMLQDTLR